MADWTVLLQDFRTALQPDIDLCLKANTQCFIGHPQQPALWFREHTSALEVPKHFQNIKDICLILAALRLAQFGCVWKYLEIEP